MAADLVTHLGRIPLSITDPEFHACLREAAASIPLIEEFRRLTGLDRIDVDFARQFVRFVYDSIYLRLPDEAIHSLRAASLTKEAAHG